MALLEIQTPTKSAFYNEIQADATAFNNLDHRSSDSAEFLVKMNAAALTAMGIPSADQGAYSNYRTMLLEFIEWLQGNYTGQTVVPRNVIDDFRHMR